MVHADNLFALCTEGLYNSSLHILNRICKRDNVCNLEECGLEHDGGLVAETEFSCNADCIDRIERDIVLCNILLHLCRQALRQLIYIPSAV